MSAFSENPGQNDSVRADLRRRCLAAREAMTERQHRDASNRIHELLSQHLAALTPGVLAFCWPMRGEFDPLPLARQLIAAGWRTCMPVVVQPAAAMVCHEWSAEMAMKPGLYDIPVPAHSQVLQPDVMLLPLVAFDRQGYRLGYGGGYFDRTLAGLSPQPITIGVGFELARVPSIFPETHDIPLDCIVTEAGLFRCPA